MIDFLLSAYAKKRQTERAISDRLIEQTLNKPTKVLYDKRGRLLFKNLYIRKGKERLLLVAAEREKKPFQGSYGYRYIESSKIFMSNKFVYDKESEVLSVEVGKGKSVDSDLQNNMVVDYDKNGDIVRINFYSFSFDDFRESGKALKEFSRRSRVPVMVR